MKKLILTLCLMALGATATDTFPVAVGGVGTNTFPVDGSDPDFISAMNYTNPGQLNPDANDYELGVVFTIDSAVSPGGGYVHGVIFHRFTANSGTHVGSLWRVSDQVRMAFVTFVNEVPGNSWQTQLFSSPVKIDPDTSYFISYSDVTGNFTWAPGGLASPISNPPITLLGGSQLKANNTPETFPIISNDTNYYVDVLWAEIQ